MMTLKGLTSHEKNVLDKWRLINDVYDCDYDYEIDFMTATWLLWLYDHDYNCDHDYGFDPTMTMDLIVTVLTTVTMTSTI